MMRAIREWYLDCLFHRISVVSAKLRRAQDLVDGTGSNQYTEGWLNHLDRRIDKLSLLKERINTRIAHVKVD